MGSLLTSLTSGLAAAEEGGGHHGPTYLGLFIYVALIVGALFWIMSLARKNFKVRVFKHWSAQVSEQLYLFIENMCIGIIGSHGRKYVPMIMTFWMVIFVSNIIALFMPTSATADLSWNLGMALIAIGYVQWEGMKTNGVFGHFGHFAGPKLGIGLIPITLMIFIIEIISELMKNVSLSLRLFGNIHGGHMAVDAMNQVGDFGLLGFISIPFGYFLIPIKLLTCVVQAMIFSLLTCVYISLVTAHHDDHHDEHDHADAAAHPAPAPALTH